MHYVIPIIVLGLLGYFVLYPTVIWAAATIVGVLAYLASKIFWVAVIVGVVFALTKLLT